MYVRTRTYVDNGRGYPSYCIGMRFVSRKKGSVVSEFSGYLSNQCNGGYVVVLALAMDLGREEERAKDDQCFLGVLLLRQSLSRDRIPGYPVRLLLHRVLGRHTYAPVYFHSCLGKR